MGWRPRRAFCRRHQSSLHDHHRQLDVAVLFGAGLFAARANIFCHGVVQVKLFGREIVTDGLGVARPEERLLRPIDHFFFEPAEKELLGHFVDPLPRQTAGHDDQHLVDRTAKQQLFEQQAGHDGLTGAGVVGQQETDARQRQHIAIDGLDLMRQNIDRRRIHGEQRVELIRRLNAVGFNAEEKALRFAVVAERRPANARQTGQLVGRKRPADDASRRDADAFDEHLRAERGNFAQLHVLVWFQPGDDITPCEWFG